jgi:hypothetical protein
MELEPLGWPIALLYDDAVTLHSRVDGSCGYHRQCPREARRTQNTARARLRPRRRHSLGSEHFFGIDDVGPSCNRPMAFGEELDCLSWHRRWHWEQSADPQVVHVRRSIEANAS